MSGVRVTLTRTSVTTTETASTVLAISTGLIALLIGAAVIVTSARTLLLAITVGATIFALAAVALLALIAAGIRDREQLEQRSISGRLGPILQVQPGAAALSVAERDELAGYRALVAEHAARRAVES